MCMLCDVIGICVSAMKFASEQMQTYFAWLICINDGADNETR
jgi:hypothetical protein